MKPSARYVLIVTLVLAFLLFVWPTPFAKSSDGWIGIRVNRFTGTSQIRSYSGWIPDTPANKADAHRYVKSMQREGGGMSAADIYN